MANDPIRVALWDDVEGLGAGAPMWDAESGTYTNFSIQSFLNSKRDGKIYGVKIPKSAVTACTKTESNAGIANPVPGTNAQAAADPYSQISPFFAWEVNGYVEDDGTPRVTAFKGDSRFSRTPAAGIQVWMLAPTLWWRMEEDDDFVYLSVCDSPLEGFELQPKAKLPTGVKRPYMIYAKYALSMVGGQARSISGQAPKTSTVSHNSLITQCKNATTGYSGKSYADDWYPKVMFLLKYANKSSQSVFAGVSNVSGGGVEDLRPTGTCDGVQGLDGAPTDPLDATEPFVLQGIELMLGMYETLGDVIFANEGDGWRPRRLLDSRFAATSVTSDYTDSGVEVPITNSTWQYSMYPSNAGGLLFGNGTGGSGTSGMGDGTFVNPLDTIATRQWLSLGYLSNGARAGLWFLLGAHPLGLVGWALGSRLSGVGRAG